jgi:hypothetical protein
MTRDVISGLSFRVGDAPAVAETRAAGIAGDIFVLSTTLPTQGITMHSTYHGHEGLDTSVVRLVLAPRGVRKSTEEHPRFALPVSHARERCLLNHLAFVREQMEIEIDQAVTIDVGDRAVAAVV